jgi:hypothetical protein
VAYQYGTNCNGMEFINWYPCHHCCGCGYLNRYSNCCGCRRLYKSHLIIKITCLKLCLFFFFKCHSRFLPYGFYATFSVGGFSFFQFHFAYPPLLPSGGATGLRGTFPGHPCPFHLTFTDIHNTYTPMGAFSRRDSNPC